MRSQVVGEYAPPGEQRVRSAITGMDNLLGGGLLTSTVTLISGPTGSGKSLLALSFLIDSARRGERSLLVSLEESPGQLRRNVRAFDWDLVGQGLLDIMHISPSELNLDRHAYEIKERAAAHRAKHVVIDSITALNAAVPEPGKHQSYLWAITDYFKRKGVTLIMTNEAADPFEALVISARGMSFVVDNIIFLRYVEVLGEIKRAVGILKARGSRHTRFIHELIIDPPALAVGSRLDYRGMLGGAQGERTIKE
jgi:circadian clock protein KaiC